MSVPRRFFRLAIFFLFAYVFGIPAFFLWLFFRFKIPQTANANMRSGLLRTLVEYAFTNHIAQPGEHAAVSRIGCLLLRAHSLPDSKLFLGRSSSSLYSMPAALPGSV